MSYEESYPWGCEKLIIHLEGSRERVVIDPNSPASVVEGFDKIIGRNIIKLVGTQKKIRNMKSGSKRLKTERP